MPTASPPPWILSALGAAASFVRGLGQRLQAPGVGLAALAGAVAGLAGLATIAGTSWYPVLRERAFDAVTAGLTAIPEHAEPVVVDIDRRTLSDWGQTQLSRKRLADLIEAIQRHQPAVIGLDVLLDGDPGEAQTAAGARSAPSVGGNVAGATTELAEALRRSKVVLGLAINSEDGGDPSDFSLTPVLARGPLSALDLWQAKSIVGPPAALLAAAAGKGVMVFSADPDGNVRRAPLLVLGAERIVPGLAVEVVRVIEDATALVLVAAPLTLAIGAIKTPLSADGMLRLVPDTAERRTRRTVSAADVIAGAVTSLAGKVVLVGSSAPELGGLRNVHGGGLVASVHLHAQAVAQLRSGEIARRSETFGSAEAAVTAVAAALSVAAALLVPPVTAAIAVGTAAAAWIAASLASFAGWRVLIDPIVGPAVMAASFGASAVAMAAETWRRQMALQRSFEQRLPPAVVRQIVRNASLLKLQGEQRIVTALFTDVEGFTALTERAAPEQLIAVLDRYFEGVSHIVVEHGGMIDKIVGDAVHAFFNAPLDLAGHAVRAFEAAEAIQLFSQDFQAESAAKTIGFGRTRIGVETGPAIVGDVGGGRKLDYTAHGNAVNAAARLEAANKVLGTTILIGPGTAAELPQGHVRPVGTIAIRGRSDPQAVFEPWPGAFTPGDRETFATAVADLAIAPSRAAAGLASLAVRHPGDPVVGRLLDQANDVGTRGIAIN